MTDPTNERKIEHLRIIDADRDVDRRRFYFDEVHLRHRALPEVNLADVDPSTVFMEKKLSFPLLISSMTGGDHALVRTINRNLAHAAEAMGVALGVGSQRVMFTNPEARSSFEIRSFAPNALLFANLGAVQLSYGFTIEHCREAVAALQADALCLHLNPLQEAVQPEGDTQFGGLAGKIGRVAQELGRPVVLKEVGSGLSREDVALAVRHGIRYIDVAGAGGTSWSRIEHHRQREGAADDLGLTFQDWGIPTPLALRELAPFRDRIQVIASGGLRSGLDMAKAMVLGASLCGMAAPFLKPATESVEQVIGAIQRLKREFTTAMFLLGATRVEAIEGHGELLLQ